MNGTWARRVSIAAEALVSAIHGCFRHSLGYIRLLGKRSWWPNERGATGASKGEEEEEEGKNHAFRSWRDTKIRG